MTRQSALAILVVFAAPSLIAAQEHPVSVSESVAERSDALHRSFEPRESLELLRTALLDGSDPELLWRAARESVHLGMLDEAAGNEDEAKRWFESAEGWARLGVRIDSTDARAQTWVAIAYGRRANLEGVLTRVEMANQVRAEAERALELDPTESGALHVLGAWHAEIRRLSTIERFTARRILGGSSFGDANWETAEELLRQAVEIEPDELVHRLELARILDDTDRRDEARAELEIALGLDLQHPGDRVLRAEAEELQRRWSGQD